MNIAYIIPSVRSTDVVERCRQSIIRQNQPCNNEIVFVTNDLLHGNANQKRNYGSLHSCAPVICFLDDDDELLPCFYQYMAPIFESPAVDFVVCGKKIVSSHHRFSLCSPPKIITSKSLFYKNNISGCSGMTVRRSFFQRLGGFDDALPASQDWDFLIRAAALTSIHSISLPLVCYHRDAENRVTQNIIAKISGLQRLYLKHHPQWPQSVRRYHLQRIKFWKEIRNAARSSDGRRLPPRQILSCRFPIVSIYYWVQYFRHQRHLPFDI